MQRHSVTLNPRSTAPSQGVHMSGTNHSNLTALIEGITTGHAMEVFERF